MTHGFDASTRLPDTTLERYRLGELTEDEAAAIGRRLREDDGLRQRLALLDASDRQIRAAHLPEAIAAGVRAKLASRAAGTRRTARVGLFGRRMLVVAAGAGALVLAILAVPFFVTPWNEAAVRLKGLEPTLVVYLKTATGSTPVGDGAVAHAGDFVRLGYRAAGHGWGVIVSIDGRGVVTRHMPREGGQAVRLSQSTETLLDVAYELDDAPRWERFYFLAGRTPFQVEPAIEAARLVAVAGDAGPPPALPLRLDVRQSSVLLIKQVAR